MCRATPEPFTSELPDLQTPAPMHLLGIDLGSSSVKVALVDASTGRRLDSAQSPTDRELAMHAPQVGWAEQDPRTWWEHTERAVSSLAGRRDLRDVGAIGIGYQMHGLVLLDAAGQPVRPSIIWCDSRAVDLGREAAAAIGTSTLATTTLNSPGNFTASKWAWVARNEPEVLAAATTAMLPGDYLAYRITGRRATTASGLSEMILWDFGSRTPATRVLAHYGLDEALLPDLVPTFGEQGAVSSELATRWGIRDDARVSYRAGDQPNNAYSLKALDPGDTAATAGTSGVVYAVTDQRRYDAEQRVNAFAHVNDAPGAERLGILLCVNGTGSAYAWLRRTLGAGGELPTYPQLNTWAESAAVGSDGLLFHPWGNGAERVLSNREPGAAFTHLSFTRHGAPELCAAVQDGIAAALAYGSEVLDELGAGPKVTRAGRANLFLSDRFCQAFAQLTGAPLELYDTDGAQGAARAAGVGAGAFASHAEALAGVEEIGRFEPRADLDDAYGAFYDRWRTAFG